MDIGRLRNYYGVTNTEKGLKQNFREFQAYANEKTSSVGTLWD